MSFFLSGVFLALSSGNATFSGADRPLSDPGDEAPPEDANDNENGLLACAFGSARISVEPASK